jgi:hypothetical protein
MDARDKPLSMILVKRVAIFMFVICSVSFIYWVIGSFGSFLDGTQSMLLGLVRLSSLGLVVFSCLGALLSVCYAAARRYRLRIMGLAGYLVVAALGASALFLAQSVIVLSRGLR